MKTSFSWSIASTILLALSFAVQVNAQGFRDLADAHPYYKGIEALRGQDIIRGNPDGTVRPDAEVSRAEFTTLILRAMKTEPVSCDTQPFSDVSITQWYAPVVCTAKEKKLVGGYPDGTFHPSQNVTLVEAAKIAVQALVPSAEIEAVRTQLYNNKENWYDVFLAVLSKRKSLPHTVFEQSQSLTRGEIAQMLYLLLDSPANEKSMTFEEFSDRLYLDLGGGYKRYAAGIWYDIGGWIDGEDVATFEVLGQGVARDKFRTYMARTGLIGGDPTTNTCSQGWCWDAKQVYAQGESIPGADPKTFRVIDKIYAKDAKQVYSIRKEIPNHLVAGADPQTFEIVDFRYQRDAKHAFFEGTLIPESHGPSFHMLGDTGIDQNHVYNDEQILNGADPNTFELTRSSYAKDSHFVYYRNQDNFHYERIPNGHVASFELFPEFSAFGFARDQARVYYNGNEVLEADPVSFQLLDCKLYRDDHHAWYRAVDAKSHVFLKMIAGVDMKTFTVDPQTCKAHDANKEYLYGKFSY